METTLATAFGRQVNVLKGEGEEITSVAAKIFINIRTRQIINGMTYFSHFPFLKSINELFIPYSEFYSSYIWIRNASLQLIKERRQQPDSSNSKDFLHLLIEAKADDNEELSSSTTKKTLTDEEIVSICVDFLLAGYETTSNCLAFTAYLLALNTDQQDKLIQSIKDFYEENEVC
jgi:cytochrome P450